MATHSSILAWEVPWTEEPGGLRFRGPQGAVHGRAHTLPGASEATHLCRAVQGLFRAEASCRPKTFTEDSFRWMRGIWENAKRSKSGENSPKTLELWDRKREGVRG